MFEGKVITLGSGITKKKQNVLKKNVVKMGGTFFDILSKPSRTGSKKKATKISLDQSITHIVTNEGVFAGLDTLADEMGIVEIPDNIKVVNEQWLEQSFSQKEALDEDDFCIEKSPKPKSGSKRKAKGAQEEEEEKESPPQKKQKQRGSAKATSKKAPAEEEKKEEPVAMDLGGGSSRAPGELWWTQGDNMLPPDMQQLGDGNMRPIANFDNWFELGLNKSILYYKNPKGIIHCNKIAAFDMDGTIIETKSGKSFAQNAKDWKFLYPEVPEKLNQLAADGYKVIIISNQLGLEKGKVTAKELCTKVTDILDQVDAPMDAFLAGASDIFRKPSPGMWDLVLNHFNGGIMPNPDDCVYVGDAAGRPKDSTRKRDFSAGDLKYAINLGIDFKTPEAFFLNSKHSVHNAGRTYIKDLDPATLRASAISVAANREQDGQELVLMCAPPASGKSTLCKNSFPGYTRINRDTLKTMQKCLKKADEALGAGESVICDNINRQKKDRVEWIKLGKKHGVPIRCVRVDLPKDVAFHLNTFRSISPYGEENRKVPGMVIHAYYKNFEAPTEKEGFSSVETIPFVPGPFKSKNEEDLFFMFSIP